MWTERLARCGVVLVVAGGVMSLGSDLLALVWLPDIGEPPAETCTDPPCLNLDLGGFSPWVLPFTAHLLLLGVALLMGGLSLLLGLIEALRRRGRSALGVGVVALAGPLVVLVGGEVLPHLLNPCSLPWLAGARAPAFCASTAAGPDVPDDWHALDHALVGFLPLSLLVAWWWRRRATSPRDSVATTARVHIATTHTRSGHDGAVSRRARD